MKRFACMFALVCGVAFAAVPDSPFTLPTEPPAPAPAPPKPGTALVLKADTFYVINSKVDAAVRAFPPGLVTITKEAGPIKIRGRFVDGTGNIETKTYPGPFVFFVESARNKTGGRVGLFLAPFGLKADADVVTATVDVAGDDGDVKPAPKPEPKPEPAPDPKPVPVPPGKRFVVIIEETAEALPARGAILANPELAARMKAGGHKFRIADKDNKTSNGTAPADLKPYLTEAAGKKLPRLYIVAPDGAVVWYGDCPNGDDAAEKILELLKAAGG